VTTNGTATIDKLHAGNASLDMPPRGPGGGPGAGYLSPPSGSSGSSGSSTSGGSSALNGSSTSSTAETPG
jgi:hypothetical protein